MNKKQEHIYDSQERPTGTDFDAKSGILMIKTKKHNIEFKGQDLRDLATELTQAITVMSGRPYKEYPAQVLIKDSRLADVVLTNESMNAFMFCSDSLSEPQYINDLRDKKFHKKDIPISSRNLNDWTHKQELLVDDRGNIEKWYTFSKIDIAYIYILKACRDFGVSVRILQTTKESLRVKLPGTDFSLLEIAYTCFDKIKNDGDIYLYMDKTGRCNIARIDDIILMAQEKMINKNFILNLTEVWNEI